MAMGASEFKALREAVAGTRAMDGQTMAALAILEDRLEQVSRLGPQFTTVGFSPDVKRLQGRKSLAVVS